MKKMLVSLITFVLVAGMSLFVYAQSENIVKLMVGKKEATVNGKTVLLDVPPQIVNGRTLVPLRFIAEALGAKIDFESKTQTITITMKNIESLETQISELNKQIDSLKADYSTKISDLEKEIQTKESKITEKELRIQELEGIVSEKEKQLNTLNEKIVSLEKEITQLKDDLKNAGGSTSETSPPVIKIANLAEGQTVSEPIKLDVKVEDQSKVVFVRAKLGSLIISEDLSNFGEIKPEKFVSGNYSLIIEAYDAFANKGSLVVPFLIKNSSKMEPVTVKVSPIDQSGLMMGGDPEKTIAMLNFQLVNKANSNIEVMKVECFDKQGNPDEIMPGMNFFDMIKSMQLGMEHLWIHSKDKLGPFPVSVDAQGTGKKAAEYYDGWKLKITLFDSIMDKEFILETSVSVK